jgi:hypothetical protein
MLEIMFIMLSNPRPSYICRIHMMYMLVMKILGWRKLFTCVNYFLLGTIYQRRNKSKSNKSTTTLPSSGVSDRAVNLDDDHEKTPTKGKQKTQTTNKTKKIKKITKKIEPRKKPN